MKKIIIMIIIIVGGLIFVKTNDVHASNDVIEKPLILVRGEYTKNIEYDNYKLISSDLNTNVVGEYLNVYQHYTTNEILYKKIYVVDKTQIENKAYYIEEKNNVINDSNIAKYKQIDDNKYVVLYAEESIYDEENINIYLTYLEYGKTVWKILIHENIYADIVDLCIDNNEIYILYNFYSTYSNMDIYLKKYSFKGEYLYSYIYSGDKNDIANKLYIKGNNCYITGNTTSEKRLFGGERNKEDSFLIIANKYKMENYKDITFVEVENDDITAIYVVGEYIYVIQYYLEQKLANLPSIKLIKLNVEGVIINEEIIDSGYALKVIGINEYLSNEFLLVYEIYNDYKKYYETKIYKIDIQNEYKNIYTYNYNSDIHLYKSFVKDGKISILYKQNGSKSGYLYQIIDLIQKEKLIDFEYSSEYYNDIMFIDHFNMLVKDNLSVQNIILNVVKVNTFGTTIIDSDKKNINDYDIILNEQKGSINIDKSEIHYNINMFGDYNLIYYLESDNLDIMYNHKIKVTNNLSITNNQTYDVNVKLTFNGIGILDGNVIESGYIVEDIGEHTLKLIGKDNIEYIYQFNIQKISPNKEKKERYNEELNQFNEYVIEQSEDYSYQNINMENGDNSNNITYTWWPMLIPITIIFAGIIVIIKGVFI